MDADTVLRIKPALTQYLHEFDGCFGRITARQHLDTYVQGQLGDQLAGARLAKVDDQVTACDFFGHQLVEGFLGSVNVQRCLSAFGDEADFGHQVLHQLPGAFTGVMIT